LEDAPLYAELASAPDGGRAFWVRSKDGVRLRVAVWSGQARGTVVILPGRAEYIEKYGLVVGQLRQRGFNTVAIDFRGQGLADRLVSDPQSGFVRDFREYQDDLDAMLGHEAVAALPGPRFLLGHSMGGAIAYRALSQGKDAAGGVLIGPMYELMMRPTTKVFLRIASWLAVHTGQGLRYLPTTGPEPYVNWGEFQTNTLTTSEPDFRRLADIARAKPEMVIGGPSLTWVLAAMREASRLRELPVPQVPVLSMIGSDETLVKTDVVERITKAMPKGELLVFDGARHELLVEAPAIQTGVWKAFDDFVERALV
jgi:lysophospholipase